MAAVELKNVTPTVVVGIGEAGCSMLSTLHDLTKEEGITEKFRFVGIDANHDDLRGNVEYEAEEVTTFELEAPEQWNENKHEYHFLHNRLLPGGERTLTKSGAQRKRRIGRYYVDSHKNFEGLKATLDSVIETFAGVHDDFLNRQGNKMDIWVMNSLSGGTGSGSFPIITGMIRDITKNTDWNSGDFIISGLGALPHTGTVSEDNLTYQLNAYAALRDIRTLTGEDDQARTELRLGEERAVVDEGDRIELPDYTFDQYFLQPFDQDDMSSKAYRHQLNKASASVPLYFSLIKGKEDWPDGLTETINERIYTFDTFELSAPVEDMERYFSTSKRILTLEEELADLEAERDRVTADLTYLNEVDSVDIETYIRDYCKEMDRNETEAKLTNIVPEEVDLPDSVSYDMVETARGAVAGLSLDLNSVEEAADQRYNREWDDTETGDVDHRDVFEYVLFQMAQRKATEEKRDHRIHEVVESKWEKYQDELIEDYAFLDAKDAPSKWRDGMRKFFDQKIDEAERNLPTGALYVGGISVALMVLLMVSLLQNIGAMETLTARSVELGSVTLSWAWTLIGLLFVVAALFSGFYAVRYVRKSSLESERQECQEAYSEYQNLDNLSKVMGDRLGRIDFGRDSLKDRQSNLEGSISRKETVLQNQQTLQERVEHRLENFEVEFDRKVALPIEDTDRLDVPGVKNKISEYIQNHPSINLEIVGEDILDTDIEVTARDDGDGERVDADEPNSISWFESRGIIEERDISKAMNEILGNRLNECVLRDYANTDPDVDPILQYVWNPANRSIEDATGGGESYTRLVDQGDYDTSQHDAEIADEFRVWLMSVYTNFYLENSSVYHDVNELYAGTGDGDERVTDEFAGGPNFVTQRFAYPEFYTTNNHPLKDEMESYPKSQPVGQT